MQLPETEDWQTAFRAWIGSQQVQDFDCGLPGLSYDPSYFANDDEIYRAWITFEDLGRAITKNHGVRLESCCFTLDEIEKEDGIYMKLDERVEPACLAWLYSWDYQGNPYYQNLAVAKRALVACMVDMAMAYEVHVKDPAKLPYISQELGSAFATWAYVYSVVHPTLPHGLGEIGSAFENALVAFFDAFEAQGPTGIQADMDLPVLIGMYYAADNLDDLHERAEAYARKFLIDGGKWKEQQRGPYYHKAGYIDHGGAFDPSYNGISLKYLTWLAHCSEWDFVIDALKQCYKLKAHLTLAEPSADGQSAGKVHSPSSFATVNAHGSANDQHWSFGRDVAASFLADEAAYLRYGYRNVESWRQPFGLRSAEIMLSDLESWTNRANNQEANPNFGTWTRLSEYKPEKWERSKHLGIPSIEWDYYPSAFYYTVQEQQGFGLPYDADSGNFIEKFGDDFVIWSLGSMAGSIHIGNRSWWNDDTALPGLSGGSLCALWTPEGGIGILGRNRGYVLGSAGDTLANMSSWAVNHIWGEKDGKLLSSALYKAPEATFVNDAEDGIVMIKGGLDESDLTHYFRTIHIKENELQVSASIDELGGFSSLYETIPLWLGDHYPDAPIETFFDEYPTIWYKKGDDWIKMMIDYPSVDHHEAEAVKIERNGRVMLIKFEEATTIKLGAIWSTTYQTKNERILPLHMSAISSGKIRYSITGSYRHTLVKS